MTKMTDIKIGDIYYLPKHNCHFIVTYSDNDSIKYTYITGDANTKGNNYNINYNTLYMRVNDETLVKMERTGFSEFLYG